MFFIDKRFKRLEVVSRNTIEFLVQRKYVLYSRNAKYIVI